MEIIRDRQAMFDTAVRGLSSHYPIKAVDAMGNCKYRGPGGSRCGVGHLIPDDIYRPFMDRRRPDTGGFGISCLLGTSKIFDYNNYTEVLEWDQRFEFIEAWLPHAEFLVDLQDTHDASADGDKPGFFSTDTSMDNHITANLRELAVKYNLDASVLDASFKEYHA